MIINSRSVALEALLQVQENQGYSNIVLDKTLDKYALDQRDKSLVSIIFRGVLEKKLTLDFIIDKFLRDKRMKLADATELLLEMAVYQIFFLERIPVSAAVNSSVDIAKEMHLPHGFINAVLRSIVRDKDKIEFPEGTDVHSLSIKYSIPEDLISLWISSYGFNNAVKLLDEFSKKSQLFLRRNNLKISASDFADRIGEYFPVVPVNKVSSAYRIVNNGKLTDNDCYENGYYHVQDLSSQILCNLVDPQPGDKVVDVCAAPGGKSFTLAEMMENKGEIYSFDLYRGRVNLIRKGAIRLGLDIINPRMRDAAADNSFEYEADRVLCDVPCSGFGTIRQKPEIRYKKLSEISDLPDIQYKILLNSSKLVRPGGLLVYSTCTLNPAENNEIADKFLLNNHIFAAVKINSEIKRVVNEPDNQLTMMPFESGTDGFFVAMFKRIN